MAIIAALELAAAIADGTNPALDLSLAVAADSPAPAEVLDLDVTATNLSTAVRPRGVRQTVLPFKVTVGGTEFPYWQRLPGMSVTESIEGPSFSWEMPRRGQNTAFFGEPLGVPTAFLGPPPGKAAINIDARVLHSTEGVQTIRLVTNGIADNSSAKVGGGGDTRSLNGIGARGRYDRALATYTMAPGHGRARNDIARQILLAASVPTGSIGFGVGGRRCYKGVQIVDQGALDFVNQYVHPALLQLSENRSGQLTLVPLAPTGNESPQWTFTEQDLLRTSELSESCAADGPTCVRVTGSKQITREDEGLRTDIRVVETYGNVPPQQALWKQGGAGSLSAQSTQSYSASDLFLLSRMTFEQEFQGDTLVSERVTEESRYNPLAYRYTLDTTGAITGYQSGVYINESDAVQDDAYQAHVFSKERFGMTSQVTTRYTYDERGYMSEAITETSRYLIRYERLKDRTGGEIAWESEDYESGVRVLGSGDGVAENEGFVGPYAIVTRPVATASGYSPPRGRIEGFGTFAIASGGSTGDATYPLYLGYSSFYPADRETTEFKATDDGYLIAETLTKETHAAKPGIHYLYQTGEFGDVRWSLQETDRVETTYAASVEGSHSIVKVSTDIQGNRRTVKEEGPGHLPAAERSIDMIDPDWATDFNEDDLLYAKAASRFEQQPMKVKLCSSALASVRPEYEEKVSEEWAEDEDELYAVAEYTIRSGCVLEVSFDLPFNPLVRPATVVHLSLPTVPLEYDVWVTSVTHTEGERETVTKVSGEVWML